MAENSFVVKQKRMNKVGSLFFLKITYDHFFLNETHGLALCWLSERIWGTTPTASMNKKYQEVTPFFWWYLLVIWQLFVILVYQLEQVFVCHFWVLPTKLGPVLLHKHGIRRRGFLLDLWVNLQKTKAKLCTYFTEHVRSVGCSCRQPSSVLQIQTSISVLTTWVKRLPSCFWGEKKWHPRPRRWVPWGSSSCASGQDEQR